MKRSGLLVLMAVWLASGLGSRIQGEEAAVRSCRRQIDAHLQIVNPFLSHLPKFYEIILDKDDFFGSLNPAKGETDESGCLKLSGHDSGFGGVVRIKATAIVRNPTTRQDVELTGETSVTIPAGDNPKLDLGQIELKITEAKPYVDPNPLAGLLYPALLMSLPK